MDKDYKILSVEPRNTYDTPYGQMQAYALKLEGVDGFVQLSQKPETPAPTTGQTIHGHTYEQNGRNGSFLKFKKVNPNYENKGGSTPQASSGDMGYIIKLLEAIAVEVGAESAVKSKADKEVDDMLNDSEPIDLSEIPF